MANLIQIILLFLSGTAIYLSQHEKYNKNKYACLFGLASSPFWLFTAFNASQWGILLLSTYCTYSWFTGLTKYWLKPYKVRISLSKLKLGYKLGHVPSQKEESYIRFHSIYILFIKISWID